jgi:hypothetical protein
MAASKPIEETHASRAPASNEADFPCIILMPRNTGPHGEGGDPNLPYRITRKGFSVETGGFLAGIVLY